MLNFIKFIKFFQIESFLYCSIEPIGTFNCAFEYTGLVNSAPVGGVGFLTSIVCMDEHFLKEPGVTYKFTSEMYSSSVPKMFTFSPIINSLSLGRLEKGASYEIIL